MENQNTPKVKSLAKALHLLQCFTLQHPEWGVTELAEKMDMTKSNAHSILSTFEQMGYVTQQPNKKYALGLRMLEYAFVINQTLGYPKAIYDLVLKTANLTDQIVYFGLPYAARMADLPYREILGEKAPLCSTGIGRAILAHLPEEEWESRLPEHIERYTYNTLTEREQIMDELQRTRSRGYGIDNQEREIGLRCVGVPIYNASGQLVAGMSASGPADVMTDEKLLECAGILKSVAMQMRNRIYQS